jgi:hypothetical protein
VTSIGMANRRGVVVAIVAAVLALAQPALGQAAPGAGPGAQRALPAASGSVVVLRGSRPVSPPGNPNAGQPFTGDSQGYAAPSDAALSNDTFQANPLYPANAGWDTNYDFSGFDYVPGQPAQ